MLIKQYISKTVAMLMCSCTLVIAGDKPDELAFRKGSSHAELSISRAVKAVALAGLSLGVTPVEASIPYRHTPTWLSNVTLPRWSTNALNYCYENCGVSFYCNVDAPWHTYDECRETTKERLFREDARQNDKVGLVAKYRLADYVGLGERLSLYREAAEGGYDEAQYKLGQMLYGSDLVEAVRWLYKAAEQGNPEAGKYLAAAYLTDSAVGVDEDKAIAYYQQSTGSDFGKAAYAIGRLYDFGWEGYLPANKEKSIQWYERAVSGNHTSALLSLANIYLRGGAGVKQDILRAYDLASRASRQGDHEARYFIATLLRDEGNIDTSIAMLRRLAREADYRSELYAKAPFALGEIYSSRSYGVYDTAEAIRYFKLARSRDHVEARERLTHMDNWFFGGI